MTEERWAQLVHRLEDVAARKPRAYRVRVGLLAGAGYGYVLLMLGLAVAAAVGVAVLAFATALWVLKFAWPLLVFAAVAMRALWIKIPEPEGLELSRADAPALWAMVDRVRQELDAPKVHRILLDDELNAGVVQTPRLGPLGPQRNHLIVGLPLMQALSEEQFTAVVAHELGHLSGNHSKFAGWIYRLRRTYAQLLEALEARRSHGTWLFRRFFEWYSPYFGAYSFALARQDEYVADGAATDVAGVGASASALIRVDLTARWLSTRYWPDLHRRVEHEAEAPRAAFTALRERLPLRDEPAGVDEALAEPTGIADTHPSLADRLAAMGVAPEKARELAEEPPARSAAAALLEEREAELAALFDAQWREAVEPEWRERHEDAAQARRRYDELKEAGPAGPDERLELGVLAYRHDGHAAAARVLREAVAERPEDPATRFWLGRALLEGGDEEGLEHLERAMEGDPDAIIPACEDAIEFLLAHDREEEARAYLERGRERAALLDAAAAERDDVSEDDVLDSHGLPEERVASLRYVLAREPEVTRAYLVRKQVQHLEEELGRPFVLALKAKRTTSDDEEGAIVQRVVDAVDVGGPILVITLEGQYADLRKKLEKVPHSEVFARN